MHDRAARVFKSRLSPIRFHCIVIQRTDFAFARQTPKLKKGNPGGRILPASQLPKSKIKLGLERGQGKRSPTFVSETS
jgi:hypothetical protein